MSRGSHAPPGRSGNPVAGQRAAGGTRLNCQGCKAAQCVSPCLFPTLGCVPSGKLCARKRACTVWEGADEKGPAMVPRQPPTSFSGLDALPLSRSFTTAKTKRYASFSGAFISTQEKMTFLCGSTFNSKNYVAEFHFLSLSFSGLSGSFAEIR